MCDPLCRVKFVTLDEIAVGVSKETVNEPVGVVELVVTVVPDELDPCTNDPELS